MWLPGPVEGGGTYNGDVRGTPGGGSVSAEAVGVNLAAGSLDMMNASRAESLRRGNGGGYEIFKCY